mmetsp:Transcript_56347/g.159942  ORF Transcript_56347/g.159942 Transcript_56347/m.159942 type:complete len:202 (+) Transcript_56347:1432-2037(+)
MSRTSEKPLLCSPDAGSAMSTSPAAIWSRCGSKALASAVPTAKPTKSQPPDMKTPGSSAKPLSSSTQPASTHPSATPFTSCIAWCASSCSVEKCSWKKSGSAPRAAMLLAQIATRSMPMLSNLLSFDATFSFVPTVAVLLISTGFVKPTEEAMLRALAAPACNTPSASVSPMALLLRVILMSGAKLAIAASRAALSTPADL